MERFEAYTSQLSLSDGISQPTSDLVVVAEPSGPLAPEARRGRLYAIVEADPELGRSAQACQLALRTLRRAFYDDSSHSITSSLRSALHAANKALYQQNMALPVRQRVTVGCCCGVLKDGELYVAQVQPAQLYVLSEGRLRAMPAHPSWDPAHVSAAPFTQMAALGSSLFIEPELYRAVIKLGDAALFCSSNVAPLLARPDAERLLRRDDAPTMAEALAELLSRNAVADAHALLIAARAGAPRPQPAPSPARKGGMLGRLRGSPPASPRPAPPPAADPLYTMPEQPTHSPNPPSRPAPIVLGESLDERYERSRRERQERRSVRLVPSPETPDHEVPPSAFLGEADYSSVTGRRIDLGDDPEPISSARPYRPRYELRPLIDLSWNERLMLPFRRIRMGVEMAMRTRRRRAATPPPPQRRYIQRGQGLSYRRTGPPFPWLLLLGLIAVISGLVTYGVLVSQENDEKITLEYFGLADERLAAVRDASDEASALAQLDAASQAIDEVAASPEVTRTNAVFWQRYQELQREYERLLAQVQRLTFFESPQVLATHPLPTGRFASIVIPPAVSNVTNTAQLEALRYIYALDADAENSQLYRIPRDGGTPEVYLTPGQAVGTAVVGPVRSALWRLDQVVAVDQAVSGFGYYFRQNDAWNYSKLGSSEIWTPQDWVDVEEYDGNLYIWGALPNEILKFSSGSYGDSPEYWLDPSGLDDIDMSTVRDMAVDGSIYLLRANGNVLVLNQGRLMSEIVPEAITPPISVVTRFAVTGTSSEGAIFLLEPLNERVIQIDKLTGKVIQQIKIRPDSELQLNELAAISVDSSGARPALYLVNRGTLLRADLPAPPRAFRSDSTSPTPAP